MIVKDAEIAEYAGFRDLEPDGILEQPFYERYNSRLEMPISFAVAVLMPMLMVFFLVLAAYAASGKDKTPVALQYLDGDDQTGVGSPGQSGNPEPEKLGAPPTAEDISRLQVQPTDIARLKEEARAALQIDGLNDVDLSDAQAIANGTLHEALRKQLNGSKKGVGGGPGGAEGRGSGPGGTGHDSTRARALRWVIKFDTRSGRDYVDQIAGLGGAILMQAKNDNSKLVIFRNLKTSLAGKVMDQDDIDAVVGWLEFTDIRRNSVEAVAEALRLDYIPPVFFARFPKELEAKLDKLERAYRNQDPKNIKETVFKVIKKGGDFDLFVVDQVMR